MINRLHSLLLSALLVLCCGCRAPNAPHVVVYTSVDQVFAEPLLEEFSRQTGVRAEAVFDIEATKTVGLANRLVAESRRPRADVFWNNEFLQTILLARQGVLDRSQPPNGLALPPQWRHPEGLWYASGARVRVLLSAPGVAPPESLRALAAGEWKGRGFAMAIPLFGTSATHAAALSAAWGEAPAAALYAALAQRASVVDGNSVVRDLVVDGSVQAGLTDSDDACAALQRGANSQVTLLRDTEALLIPGTVAKVKGAPHPEQAALLIDWLLKPETEQRLVQLGAAQATLHGGPQAGGCLHGRPLPPHTINLEAISAAAKPSRHTMTRLFSR